MRGLYEMREALCKVTEEYARKGELSPGAVDIVDKALNAIKNSYKIEMFENQAGGGFGKGGSYDSYGMDSYRRGYSRDSGSYGDSYDSGSYEGGNSGRRGYSMDGGKEHLMKKLREMMNRSYNEEEKETFRKAIKMLEEE